MATPSTASSILAASLEVIGGSQVVAGVHSISGIADCTSPRGPYITELYSARSDRLLFKQVRPTGDPFIAVINGAYAWAVDSNTQQVERLDERSAAMILGHDFLMLPLLLEHRFKNPVAAGVTDFANKRCEKLQATDHAGQPCELYFAADTHRVVGMVIANPIGAEGETVEIVFAEWQLHGEIMLPALVIITDKSGEYRFVFRQVSLNSIDEEIFAIPAEITRGSSGGYHRIEPQ